MNIRIVGAGPSAAYAVLACRSIGVEPVVISNAPPHTNQAGAFFLHWLPEWFVEQTKAKASVVQWVPLGSKEVYLAKQGYHDLALPCSFPVQEQLEWMYSSAWLDAAWDGVKVEWGNLSAAELAQLGEIYDFVFYTFPAVKHGRVLDNFPVLDARTGIRRNKIVYSGLPEHAWVRMTQAFGRLSYEYPRPVQLADFPPDKLPFEQHWLRDIPPSVLPLDASEYPAANVIPIGRFAEWQRKRLSHEVYARVLEVLNG